MTQVLLRAINMSGKLHMVPAVINDDYVIRFAVCSASAADDDILYAWKVITETTSMLESQSASFDLHRPEEVGSALKTMQPVVVTKSQNFSRPSVTQWTFYEVLVSESKRIVFIAVNN